MVETQQPPPSSIPSPHRTAALGLLLFIMGGVGVGLASGVMWGYQIGWLMFGGSTVAGLLWSVMLMSATINHRAYLERRVVDAQATRIEYESKTNLVIARTEHMKQEAAMIAAPQQAQLPAPMQGTPNPQQPTTIRVMIAPRKGPVSVVECSTRVVQWAISDCWPLAAREYVTTDGQKIRVWKHRDQDFTEVAQFMVKIGAWVESGSTFGWREGITQQSMIEWYRTAMRNGGEAGLPEALSPVMSALDFNVPA